MGYHVNLTYDKAVENCPEGYEIVTADDYTLQIDYDHPLLPVDFQDKLNLLYQRINRTVISWWKTPSKSGNLHVTIKLPIPMTIEERIAWQAAFGSDPKREMLGLTRVARGSSPYPVLFFEKKGLVPEVYEVGEGRMFRGDND